MTYQHREIVRVLDHGYIKTVEHWGSDESIIEAARMSTQKGFLGWGPTEVQCENCGGTGQRSVPSDAFHPQGHTSCPRTKQVPGDERLLKYLYENKHATPFEFAGLVIEVQAPIFVFREWHRHRTQSYNEASARYSPLPALDYMPTVERCLMVNGKNRQAGAAVGAGELTHEDALTWLEDLADLYKHAEDVYQRGLKIGIPKEVARCPMPVARYSKMRAHTCLRNWLAFMTLRSDKNPGAQLEIRAYANALHDMLKSIYPRTMSLFDGEA